MNSRETLGSIREVNLSYIMLAQRLLREDRPAGLLRLGMSPELADILSGLTPPQTVRLAASDHLLCVFRFNEHAALSALTEPAKQIDIAGTHTAVLLAGQPPTQFT